MMHGQKNVEINFKLVGDLALSHWSKIYARFWWGSTHFKHFPSSCNIWHRRWAVSHLGITSTTITPSESQMAVIMTLPADSHFLKFFFPAAWGFCHSKYSLFASSPKWKTCVPSAVNNPGKECLSVGLKMCQKLFSFTFMWPCIVTNFFVIKPTRCTNFANLFCHETLHVSHSSSVHHQEFILCTLSNGICHTGL